MKRDSQSEKAGTMISETLLKLIETISDFLCNETFLALRDNMICWPRFTSWGNAIEETPIFCGKQNEITWSNTAFNALR